MGATRRSRPMAGAVVAGLLSAAVLAAGGCTGDRGGEAAGDGSTTSEGSRAPDRATTTSAASTDPTGTAGSGPALDEVRIELRLLARLDEPVAMAVRPADPVRGRVHVAERGGRVLAVGPDGDVSPTPVVDLRDRTVAEGERGLLGIAFSPDGRHLYVDYTDRAGHTNVDELPMRPDGTADPARRRRLLFVEQPYRNHNGGHLVVGSDGMLYVGTGDGGSAGDPQGNGQDLGSLLGKVLRIDPTPSGGAPYTIPPDNPFVGVAGARPEIWSYGLRNPWRFAFDEATGDLWIADVGQNSREEIDVARAGDGAGAGANFGWNAFEGSRAFDPSVRAEGAVAPVHEYDHDDGGCSVTGGFVYRGRAVPSLAGAYLFADYCLPGIRALDAGAAGTSGTSGASGTAAVVLLEEPSGVVSFGQDADGEVLVATLGGSLFRLQPAR